MRFFKFLFAIWAAVLVYTLFTFISGPKGLSAYNQLLFERERQLENVKELGLINEELQRIKNNLLFDVETQLVYARQLGYAQENEQFIRIVGLGSIKPPVGTTGNLYVIKEPDFISDKYIKITAIFIGLLIFAFLFVMELIETRVK